MWFYELTFELGHYTVGQNVIVALSSVLMYVNMYANCLI
jgi:hypothetical protein